MQEITLENTTGLNLPMLNTNIQPKCVQKASVVEPFSQQGALGSRLIYVMGPSGAGKDSVMHYAHERINSAYSFSWQSGCQGSRQMRPLMFARRYITRSKSQDTTGSEDHYPVSLEDFQRLKTQNAFALDWESHGLHYGIPAEIHTFLIDGAVVVVNGSRKALPLAVNRFPNLLPVLIEARQEILQRRLESRKREGKADIARRLLQSELALPEVSGLIRIDNSFALTEAGEQFTAVVRRLREYEAA